MHNDTRFNSLYVAIPRAVKVQGIITVLVDKSTD